MESDMRVNDEFLSSQAHTIIWDLALGEGLFRNGQVHHDLGLGFRQFA